MKNKTIEKFPLGEIAKLYAPVAELEAEWMRSKERVFKAIPKDPNYKPNHAPIPFSVSGVHEVNYDKKRNSESKKES